MKLISITESSKPDKKLQAVFETDSGRTKTVHFGQRSADDYTITGDKAQRERYRTRHQKDLQTHDPTRSGYLSYFILWGEHKSRAKNIAEYKRRFNL